MELDRKTGVLMVDLEHFQLAEGLHNLEVKIGDGVNNFKTFRFDFIW